MDNSGVLPIALKRAMKQVTKTDFADATDTLNEWGLSLSKSQLERLSQSYAKTAWQQAKAQCKRLIKQPLEKVKAEPRRFIIETDGCNVLERNKSGQGGLEGREVKSLIIYPLNQPSKRVYLSSPITITEFRPLARALLRQAGVQQNDICLGLGDGATWVRDLLSDLGCQHSLLDVFHAVDYLDTVLKTLGYDDQDRLNERQCWLRGEVDGALWLQSTQAHYNLTDALRQTWAEDTQTAWNYLQTHAQQGALAYPRFKDQGWVIGSGQIEGYNKWAILERMRGSGMHWSTSGLKRMAFLRSEFASTKPLTDFHHVRLQAFA